MKDQWGAMLDMVKGTIILEGEGMKKREQLNNWMSFFVCVHEFACGRGLWIICISDEQVNFHICDCKRILKIREHDPFLQPSLLE